MKELLGIIDMAIRIEKNGKAVQFIEILHPLLQAPATSWLSSF